MNASLQDRMKKMKCIESIGRHILQERQRKAKHFYIQSQESQKKLEERLSHEEDTVAALREELSMKELSISELKSSMKQISSQLQDSVEENMDINDKLKKLQIINSKGSLESNRKIYKQLRRNVNKLKDLVKLYYQKKEGHDLELSLLLGTAGGEASRTVGNQEQSLSDEVRALTNDIDELRTFLADQYAEELANNIEGNNCITQ
ncbi:centrosomal protein of 85 kDa-like [Dendronephthya gigantea]|uniref:centrosomal protein of 85 kDa-like n=1 Tax=Dendronephthya gigantea TaxID=151771 RepID=UPI00106916C9|nr:centrosomal protein of 85 kDa-like [Dendronephthya gigantea]